MKHRIRFLLPLLLLILLFALVACGETPTPEPPNDDPIENPNDDSGDNTPSDDKTPVSKVFEGIAFPDKTVTYDGTEHTLAVTGMLPSGTTVVYENEKGTNAGTYSAKVTLSKEGYTTLSLTATLTINKADFAGITFPDKTVTYDGTEHVLTIAGTLPEGASVVYENEKGTNAGTYSARVTLSRENYNTKVLTATLTVNKADFTDITFPDKTVTYDGTEHVLTIEGTLPEGASVVYENEKGTNSGTYSAKVTLSRENYNTKVLTATLTVNKADFTGITFTDKTVTYDGTEHVLTIVGTLPEGASVVYENAKGTNAGTYSAKVTLSRENYNTKVLTATLTVNKANFTGITFPDRTLIYTGNEATYTVNGEIPVGTEVIYSGNLYKEEGTYHASVTLRNPNYNDLTLTATLIVRKLADIAEKVVNAVIARTDPWDFLPPSLRPENMACTGTPAVDFTDFVAVSAIANRFYGKQLNVLIDGLSDASTVLAYADRLQSAAGQIVALYQDFINQHPDDFSDYSAEVAGFRFRILLEGDTYHLLAGNGTVNYEIVYDAETGDRAGRVGLTNGIAIRYNEKEDYLKLAVMTTVSGVGNLKQIEFLRGENGIVAGTFYEYTGTEGKGIKTSAVVRVDDTYTTVLSNKRETDDLKILGYEEVYDSESGEYLVGRVKETVKLVNFDTYWLMLNRMSGIDTIKAIHELNGDNADTIYINGSAEAIHTKLVGGLSLSAASRRFDIEMKEVYYITAVEDEDGNTKYVKEKTTIPMIFVQDKFKDSLASDFTDANSVAVTADITPCTIGNLYYDALYSLFETVKDSVSYESVVAYVGTKNPYFDTQTEE